MENIKICEVCGFQTSNGKVMSNHKRWKHVSPSGSESYNKCCEKLSKNKSSYFEKVRIDIICKECGNKFEIEVTKKKLESGKYKKYCSASCRNKQGSKYVDYSKVSEWAKANPRGCCSQQWKAEHKDNAFTRKNFSKRELEIVDYLKSNFPNDEWKQGFIQGTKKYENKILSPDLHSNKLKVVIEYDGVWHFKDIYGQLEKKQEVDRSMLHFCRENGFRLIRIDEDDNVTNEMIADAIYNSTEDIILFNSKRYDYLFK